VVHGLTSVLAVSSGKAKPVAEYREGLIIVSVNVEIWIIDFLTERLGGNLYW
jgi:hypothetical protein